MKKLLYLCVLTSLFLFGCEGLVTKADLKESESRKANQDQVTAMQKANAESTNRYNELEASIREVNGRMDVLENRTGLNDQTQGKTQHALEEQLTESNKKVALLQEEMTKIETQMQALTEQVNANTAAMNAAASAKAAEANPANAKAEKAKAFDAGEEHFQKKEWKRAIFNYQKYRDAFPKGKKFAEATYKIGVCFQELGMKDEAKTFYDELVAKFPGSAEAQRAKVRLKKLK